MGDNLYSKIIEAIFFAKYRGGVTKISFIREEITRTANDLNIPLPKNLGDLVYSFRYRKELPERILKTAPKGKKWEIKGAGRAKYSFILTNEISLEPSRHLSTTKIPDSTPGIVSKYSFNDEQALLTKVRYNRLIDVFSGITCYSLQNHLRTTVPGIGQVETDEIYVGLDKRGSHYVFPVQAKSGSDKLGIIQIEQDFAICDDKFPNMICRPIAAQFIEANIIVLFEFERIDGGVAVASEKHYRLVLPDAISDEEIALYAKRLEG